MRYTVGTAEDGRSTEEILEERRALCNITQQNFSDGLYCPQEFDGWSCVPSARAGSVAEFACPGFIFGFDPARSAYRPCLEDGTWFRHPESNKTWSNYTTCVDQDDLQLRTTANVIYKTGYTVSLIALVMSLVIFYYFKTLTCTRIRIHKNLFLSLALNNFLWLIWYKAVVNNIDVLIGNGLLCRLLHVQVHYFMVATYFWMFCEGLYLYTILVITFLPENRVMSYLHCIGWGIPAILVLLYTTLRANYSSADETKYCWMEESPYSIVLSLPVCVSMIANLVFLFNIVRILLKKLPTSSMSSQSATSQALKSKSSCRLKSLRRRTLSRADSQDTSISAGRTKKAVRATLILIPLLGLQYILTPFRPEPNTPWEPFYQIVSAIVTSGQGVCVALLFCFCNGEVLSTIRRRWNQSISNKRHSWQPYSATTTVSFSRSSFQHNHQTPLHHLSLQQQAYQPPQENEAITPPSVAFRLDCIPPPVSL